MRVSSEHWLTEIRIPVGEEALRFAGTLGEFTDVKALPAHQVVVAEKPQGQADPGQIYDNLTTWVMKQGYIIDDGFSEIFPAGAQSADYSQMKTNITAPIKKLPKPSQ